MINLKCQICVYFEDKKCIGKDSKIDIQIIGCFVRSDYSQQPIEEYYKDRICSLKYDR